MLRLPTKTTIPNKRLLRTCRAESEDALSAAKTKRERNFHPFPLFVFIGMRRFFRFACIGDSSLLRRDLELESAAFLEKCDVFRRRRFVHRADAECCKTFVRSSKGRVRRPRSFHSIGWKLLRNPSRFFGLQSRRAIRLAVCRVFSVCLRFAGFDCDGCRPETPPFAAAFQTAAAPCGVFSIWREFASGRRFLSEPSNSRLPLARCCL